MAPYRIIVSGSGEDALQLSNYLQAELASGVKRFLFSFISHATGIPLKRVKHLLRYEDTDFNGFTVP